MEGKRFYVLVNRTKFNQTGYYMYKIGVAHLARWLKIYLELSLLYQQSSFLLNIIEHSQGAQSILPARCANLLVSVWF